jgi:hypothetical protein
LAPVGGKHRPAVGCVAGLGATLPGGLGAGQHERGGERGQFGASDRGVGQVAGENAVEQPAVAAVVESRDHRVRRRAGRGRRHRPVRPGSREHTGRDDDVRD